MTPLLCDVDGLGAGLDQHSYYRLEELGCAEYLDLDLAVLHASLRAFGDADAVVDDLDTGLTGRGVDDVRRPPRLLGGEWRQRRATGERNDGTGEGGWYAPWASGREWKDLLDARVGRRIKRRQLQVPARVGTARPATKRDARLGESKVVGVVVHGVERAASFDTDLADR